MSAPSLALAWEQNDIDKATRVRFSVSTGTGDTYHVQHIVPHLDIIQARDMDLDTLTRRTLATLFHKMARYLEGLPHADQAKLPG